MEDLQKMRTISEYIDRLYPNVSRSMKEDIAKDMMNSLSNTGMHNLRYAMDKDDGFEDNAEQ